MFLESVDWQEHGQVVIELNNNYLAGQNNYPKSAEEVVLALVYSTNHKSKMKNKNRFTPSESLSNSSFAQVLVQAEKEDQICCCCGKADHISTNCPKKDQIPKKDWYFSKATQHMQVGVDISDFETVGNSQPR